MEDMFSGGIVIEPRVIITINRTTGGPLQLFDLNRLHMWATRHGENEFTSLSYQRRGPNTRVGSWSYEDRVIVICESDKLTVTVNPHQNFFTSLTEALANL